MNHTLPLDLNQSGIYLITNTINKKQYIGQACNLNKRWREHIRLNGRQAISRAMQKYGIENFTFDVIEFCAKECLDELETLYISLANSVSPNGYNIQIIAKTQRGLKLSEEAKRKIGAASKRAWQVPKAKAKRSAAIRNALACPIVKERHSISLKNSLASPKSKEKSSNAKKDIWARVGHREKVVAAIKATLSRPEIKKKHKASLIKAFANPETKQKLRIAARKNCVAKQKKVAQYSLDGELIAKYDSVSIAARSLDKKKDTAINNCLRGRSKTAYGFLWKYC